MKYNDNRLHVRVPASLLTKAHQTARESNETLSRLVRAYLESYVASQPLKTTSEAA
ncbi:DUF6364 family protein [Hymenobacter latericus]|uniref:DUF6364 family protein n=1 Tax=Hymenobacter sp. YIM 151858-1 TaxID=2987688 RepID=UPI0039B47EF5